MTVPPAAVAPAATAAGAPGRPSSPHGLTRCCAEITQLAETVITAQNTTETRE